MNEVKVSEYLSFMVFSCKPQGRCGVTGSRRRNLEYIDWVSNKTPNRAVGLIPIDSGHDKASVCHPSAWPTQAFHKPYLANCPNYHTRKTIQRINFFLGRIDTIPERIIMGQPS